MGGLQFFEKISSFETFPIHSLILLIYWYKDFKRADFLTSIIGTDQ